MTPHVLEVSALPRRAFLVGPYAPVALWAADRSSGSCGQHLGDGARAPPAVDPFFANVVLVQHEAFIRQVSARRNWLWLDTSQLLAIFSPEACCQIPLRLLIVPSA